MAPSPAQTSSTVLPSWVFADARAVAEQAVDAGLSGTVVYTHGWANRLVSAVLRAVPLRYANRLMRPERARILAERGQPKPCSLPGSASRSISE